MLRSRGRTLWIALALVLAAVVWTPASAPAATITACVNKTTGEVKIRSGKAAKRKCPKGWKRVRWTDAGKTGKSGRQGPAGVPGAQGVQGPAGPSFNVKDATGAVVGQFVGIMAQPFPFYIVLRDGGYWYYLGSGTLYPIASPNWKTADCSGTAYFRYGGGIPTAIALGLFGGPFRLVFRTTSASAFGPSSAWKAKGTSETLGAPTQLYELDSSTGACTADGGPATGDLFPLDAVTAPPDYAGPLVIG